MNLIIFPLICCWSLLTGTGLSFLRQPPVCQSSCLGVNVVNDMGLYKTRTLTQAAWIVFHNTTAACYKQAGDKILYFRLNCSREHITHSLLNNR